MNLNKNGEGLVVISIDLAKGLENVNAQVKIDISANNITVSVNQKDGIYNLNTSHPDSDISPETIAAITAAAYEAIGKPFRVKSIKMFSSSSEDSSWVRMGRLNLITSHNILQR